MSFGFKRQNIYTMSVKDFSGIDLSNGEKNLLGKNAKMMENMFINENGKPEKRRGFRYLYKGENVNGVYEYLTGDKDFYILHEGESFYLLEKENDTYKKGELIFTGAEDKTSSGFVFGGSLYIMAGGYFKIGFNKFFNALEVGRVSLSSTKDINQVVVTGRNQGALDGETVNCINAESENYVIKYSEGKYWFDGTSKLYVAPPEAYNLIRVVSVKVGSLTIDGYQYVIGCDDIGVFVKLSRVNTNLKEFYNAEAEVTFSMGGFCYAPKNIVSRLAVGLDDLDGNIIEEHASREHFTGEYLEDLNLASPLRKVNFFVNLSDFPGATHIRFYLEPGKSRGRVLRITAGGNMINSYYIQADDPYKKEQAVFSYENEYVDIKKSLLRELFSSNEAVVEIEYIKGDFKSDIDGCSIFGFYDSANDVRVFVSGNKEKGSFDYMSGIYDGTYFPALSYTSVGQDVSKILGYGRYFSYQLIFKDEKGDASLYFRCPDEKSGFKILKGAASEAAVSSDAVINVNSKLFFLSDSGLFEISSTQVEGETKNVLRSKEINELLKSEDLKNLKLSKFSDFLYITGGKYVYVLDILKDYAWYVYSLPYEIKKVSRLEGDVFIVADGIIRKKDKTDKMPYADENEEEESAVRAYFRTNDVLFRPYGKRNILNAYCILDDVFTRSGAKIFYHSDDYSERLAKKADLDLFSFEDISFLRFSFFTERAGRSIKTNLRSKRVERFSLTIKNENAENLIIEEIGFLYS